VLEFRCGWVEVVSVLQTDVCRNFGVVGLEWYPCCRLSSQLLLTIYVFHGFQLSTIGHKDILALKYSHIEF